MKGSNVTVCLFVFQASYLRYTYIHIHTYIYTSGDAFGLPLAAVLWGDTLLHPAARRKHHDRLAQIQCQVSVCMYVCMYVCFMIFECMICMYGMQYLT